MKLTTLSRRTATTTGLAAALAAVGAVAVLGTGSAHPAAAAPAAHDRAGTQPATVGRTTAPQDVRYAAAPAAHGSDSVGGQPITASDLTDLRVPAGHGCEYLGDAFSGSFRLHHGSRVVDGVGVSLEKSVIADLDGDGLDDGVALLRCQGPTGPGSSVLGVRWGGSTGALSVLDWTTDAPLAEGVEPGFVEDVRWEQDGSGETVLAVVGRAFRPEDALAQPTAAFGYAYRVASRAMRPSELVPND